MSLVTNVVRRGGRYYFRTRVPIRHRELIARAELWRSLGTSEPIEARRRAGRLAALTSSLWGDLERVMSMKDGHEVIKSWLKAELDDYAAMKAEINGELKRVSTPRPPATLDLDAEPEPLAKGTNASTSKIGLTIQEAANRAIPEIVRLERLRPKRRNDYENAVKAFIAWNGGDLDLGCITAETVGAFKSDLTYYPARGSQRPQYRELGWKERVASARANNELDVLDAVTINNKYLGPLRSIIRFHLEAGLWGRLGENPFDGITVKKRKGAKKEARRRDFTAREVQSMFRLPLFVGSRGTAQAALYKPGELRVSDWRYWVPLISFFTGARLNEVCALAVADFKTEGDIHYLMIRDLLEGQNRKSEAAWRRVPLHRELLRVRLPDFVAARQAQGEARLFGDLPVDAFGYVSGPPSKFFARLTKSVEEPDPDQPGRLVFYSTRHTVVGRLRSAGVRMDTAKQIVGHEDGDVHAGYGGLSLHALKEAVDKIEYEGLDLGPVVLPESVLPKAKS